MIVAWPQAGSQFPQTRPSTAAGKLYRKVETFVQHAREGMRRIEPDWC